MAYKQGDIVFLRSIIAPIAVMFEHSGYYDYQYTGSDPEGNLFYFNDEDVVSEAK